MTHTTPNRDRGLASAGLSVRTQEPVAYCDACLNPLEAISPAQSEYVSGKTFRIPFTDICLTIYHDKPTVQYGCLSCIIDRQDSQQRDMYDQAFNDGVERAEVSGFRYE